MCSRVKVQPQTVEETLALLNQLQDERWTVEVKGQQDLWRTLDLLTETEDGTLESPSVSENLHYCVRGELLSSSPKTPSVNERVKDVLKVLKLVKKYHCKFYHVIYTNFYIYICKLLLISLTGKVIN